MAKITADQIAENATQPKSISADGVNIQQHDISSQIAADQYRRKQATLTSGNPFNKLVRVRTIARGAND